MTAVDEGESLEAAFQGRATIEVTARLSDDKREQLRRYWIDRADGELTTALSFEYMLDDLRAVQAPGPLLELAERAIAEEHAHVDWCERWASRLDDGAPVKARLSGTRPLRFDGASDRDDRILRTVFGCCFSETTALHVLTASHALITLESAKLLNHLHMKEEVGHARLGWGLLAWEGLTARDRSMIGARVPEMLELNRLAWLSTVRPADDELHALGFLSSDLVRAACEEALERVILPGLAHHGVRSPTV